MLVVGLAVSGGNTYDILLSSWAEDLISTPTRLWVRISPESLKAIPEKRRNEFELYEWARTHTSVDSLFYYDSLAFRFWAQRSLTHCSKDLGLAYYRRERLIEFYDRYERLQGAYAIPDQLLSYAQEYEADYIVTTRAQEIDLDLPIAFENSAYVVYQLV
jgi:hypothetical protein